jgi:hypothetical protein
MSAINDFKSRFTGGGARPNLFKVIMNYPAGVSADVAATSFMIKGASIPAGIIAETLVPYMGRQLKVAGDRTFEPMSLTVINDTDMAVRKAFETWMNIINAHESNTGATNPAEYQTDFQIQQLGRGGDGDILKEYSFVGSFPTNLSAIDLNWETNDSIEEFTVELGYQYWTSETTT